MLPTACGVGQEIFGCFRQDDVQDKGTVAINGNPSVTCPYKLAEGGPSISSQALSLVDDVDRGSRV